MFKVLKDSFPVKETFYLLEQIKKLKRKNSHFRNERFIRFSAEKKSVVESFKVRILIMKNG